jgi:DegV family protein with EDD domain
MLVLFTDTDTDLTPAEAKEFGYHMISMPYSIDGVTTYPYEDFDTFDAHAFYDKLRGGVLPNTSAISTQKYKEYFEPHFKEGNDILYVHFSRNMTATFDNMDIAVKELLEQYPDCKFYEIDTMGITLCSLMTVKEIGDLYKAGKSAEEMLEWAKTEVNKVGCYFFADDLKFFKHSGRVSGIAGTMGTLLGIRPIIYMNEEGKMVSVGKEKGRVKAMERLISFVDQLGENVKDHRVLVGHADCRDIAEGIEKMLKEKYGDDLRTEIVDVNPTAGSHCGPNTVGVCFHAKRRSL